MRRTVLTILFLLGPLLVLQAAVSSQGEQHDMRPSGTLLVEPAAQAPMMRVFTIYVGTTGFNSTGSTGMTLAVNEGDSVAITFVYNDTDLRYNNPHEILIEGYDLHSGTLDRSTPQRTVMFTANIPGPTTFRCSVTNCKGHGSLLTGVLDVQLYSGPRIPTSLSLSAQASRDNVTLSVQAVDMLSSPIPGLLVHFYRNSTWGFGEIGEAATNSGGGASLVYDPPSTGVITLKADFQGSGLYSPSSSSPLEIDFPGSSISEEGFPYVWGQNTLMDVRIVGVPAVLGLLWVSMIFLIAGSVWATYLYVGRQLLGVWKGAGLQPPGIGESNARVQRTISYPTAIVVGLGMVALGYADLLMLGSLAPNLSLLVLPFLGFIEAVLAASLLSRD